MSSAYILNPEQPSELTRLLLQSRLIASFAGYLEEQPDLSKVHDILDLACGPGDWALSLASKFHPDHPSPFHLTGVDRCPVVIEHAQNEARARQLENVTFLVADILEPLPFADGSFDLINARMLATSLHLDAWPRLLARTKPLLRPGGVMRLMESGPPASTSPALHQFGQWQIEALHRVGYACSATGRSLMAPLLGKFLFDAGYTDIDRRISVYDWSAWTGQHTMMVQGTLMWYKSVQPFLEKTGVATQEAMEACYACLVRELQSPDFCGLWLFLTVWGTKP